MADRALIVGASRGIGLALTREYLARGWAVTATERARSDALHATGARVVSGIDVADPEARARLAAAVEGPIDLLFLVAGVWGPQHQSPARASSDEAAAMFLANAVGPVALAEALADKLAPRATAAFMSSGLGSIGENASGGATLYRGTKAALAAMAVSFARAHPRLTVRVLDPGWVRTDMGGPNATITAEQSARGLADVLAGEAGGGDVRFLSWRGVERAW